MSLQVGQKFEHNGFQCTCVSRNGNVVLFAGQVFERSPRTWCVAKLVSVPAMWRGDLWPWRWVPAHERMPRRGDLEQVFSYDTEAEAKEAFQRLAGGGEP